MLREILADVLAVLALGAVIALMLWFGGVGF
jgi:hypothetical protein